MGLIAVLEILLEMSWSGAAWAPDHEAGFRLLLQEGE
jgi:hypothetical protein